MSGEGAAPAVERSGEPNHGSRRTGIHIALIVTGVVAFVAAYAGAQYLIARHRVVTIMGSSGFTIEAVRIDRIELTDAWSIQVWWLFRDKEEPDHRMTIPTETSWLGLGSTEINRYVIQAE